MSALGSLEMPWQPGAARYESVSGTFLVFTEDEMKDAYEFLYGVTGQITWMRETRGAWRIGSGILFASGDPIFPDSTWEVSSSELQMLVFPADGDFIYNFKERPGEKSVAPYVGIGVGGYFGFERVSVQIARSVEGSFDWNDTRFRYVLDGHVFAGTAIGITERYRAILEVRWTQSGKGSTVENSFSDEEIAEGWLEADKAVQRPDFDFTGLSVSVGLQW